MIVIRLQRTGRKGSAQFRIVVQDKRRTPKSGKIVSLVGNYDPHTKKINIDKEKVTFYLNNGAQPSERVAKMLKASKIELPKWVKIDSITKKKITKNPDKRRSTAPQQPEEIKDEAKNEDTTPSNDEEVSSNNNSENTETNIDSDKESEPDQKEENSVELVK